MKRRPGLSLLEAMIALTLFGMIWMGGQHALALVRKAAEAPGDRGDGFVLARQLQDWLSAAQPVRSRRRDNAPLLFQGEAGRIAFVTDLPARFGQAGPHLVNLKPDRDGIVMSWAPLRTNAVEPKTHLIAPAPAGLRLRYRETPTGPWLSEWQTPTQLPAIVELRLGPEDEPWTITARLRAGG